MWKPVALTAALLLPLAAAPLQASDFDAEHFHQQNCMGCHDTGVYTRSNRRVQTLPALEKQVRMCDANLGTKLFDDDVKALVRYMNTTWYQF